MYVGENFDLGYGIEKGFFEEELIMNWINLNRLRVPVCTCICAWWACLCVCFHIPAGSFQTGRHSVQWCCDREEA